MHKGGGGEVTFTFLTVGGQIGIIYKDKRRRS